MLHLLYKEILCHAWQCVICELIKCELTKANIPVRGHVCEHDCPRDPHPKTRHGGNDLKQRNTVKCIILCYINVNLAWFVFQCSIFFVSTRYYIVFQKALYCTRLLETYSTHKVVDNDYISVGFRISSIIKYQNRSESLLELHHLSR